MPRAETKGPVTLDDPIKEIKASSEVSKGFKIDLKKLSGTVMENHKSVKTFMDKTNKVIDELTKKNKELDDKVKTMDYSMTAMSDQLSQTEKVVKEHDAHIQTLLKKNRILEDEQRRQNIIVEGLKEDPKVQLRQQVLDMMTKIREKIRADNIVTVLWLGPGRTKGNRPRPILVTFANVNTKYKLYRNVKNLSNDEK